MFAALNEAMKQFSILLTIFSFTIVSMALLSSCANMIPPGGGPRDSLPPRLVMANPKDSGTNISTRTITLTFDEYIALQNPQDNIIITPVLKYIPQFDDKLRNVTIRLRDTLEPNTTYSFDFGEAVKDVNEGNIARNLVYTFSTGNKVDFNTYSGKVLVAETGKIDSSLWVVLHKDLSDTAVIKKNPRYYTRINGKGEFSFKNLPEGDFAVYVVSSKFSKKYDDSTRLFAFKNELVKVNANTLGDTLYAFEEYKAKPIGSSNISQNRTGTTTKEDKRLKYGVSLDNGQQDLLSDYTLTFNRKLNRFDTSGFVLYDTGFHKLSGYQVSLDTGKTKVTFKYPWKQKTGFRLIIAKDAVADTGGITLAKADSLRFITKSETDYGSIRIKFANLDMSRNPVLQLITNDKLLESVPLKIPDFSRKMYQPGTYDIRILYDMNKNGIWDTGHFGKHQQPEIVQRIPRQVVIRSNWDNEVTITL